MKVVVHRFATATSPFVAETQEISPKIVYIGGESKLRYLTRIAVLASIAPVLEPRHALPVDPKRQGPSPVSPHETPAPMMSEVQHLAEPPERVPHPVPPQYSHSSAQHTSPSRTPRIPEPQSPTYLLVI